MASVRAVQTGQEALREVATGDWSLLILNEDVGDAPAADVLTRYGTELGLTGFRSSAAWIASRPAACRRDSSTKT